MERNCVLGSELAQKHLRIVTALDLQRDATAGREEQKTKTVATSLRSAEQEGAGIARAFGGGLLEAARAGEDLLGTLTGIGETLLDLVSSRLLEVFAQQADAPG